MRLAGECVSVNDLRPRIIDLPKHVDDRGWLFEGTHEFELPRGAGDPLGAFGQLYVVHSRTRGTVRAFHRHTRLWDLFQPAAGSAKFVIWKGQVCGAAVEVDEQLEIVLSVDAPKLLIVPPTWYHGWAALEDHTTIVSVGSELYNRAQPDEERIPWDVLGDDIWTVRNK